LLLPMTFAAAALCAIIAGIFSKSMETYRCKRRSIRSAWKKQSAC
jgi:hypothetical protein